MSEMRAYPCDISGECPFNAVKSYDCYNCCGLGADEDSIDIEEADDNA